MTTIQDTVYNAAGVPANGQIVIDSPPFTLNGVSVAASQITTPIVDGILNVQLFPNMNAQPTGVYYTARYELDQGPVFEEYWVVPNQPTVNLGQVRVNFPATPSVMINAQQLTSAGALPGQFLGWSGGNWVPMYVTSFNYYPNFINLYLTGFQAADLSVTGSPASLGGGFSLNVPDAGQASRGVVTTGPQTFSGNKVFANNVAITGSLTGPNAVFTDLTVTGQLLATGQSNLLLDPTTTLGDLIVRGQQPPPTRFAAGSNGTVLTSDSTQPLGLRWGPAPAPNPTTQTGDLLVRGPGVIQRLGVGSNGQVLTADNSQPLGMAWEAAAGGVPATRMIATGLGLTGGGNLSQDLLLSVVPDTTNQQVMVLLDGGAPIGTRHAINFIEGANVTLVIGDDPTDNRINVTIASTGGPLPPGSVTSVFGRNGDVIAMSGDYTAAQVTNAVSVLGSYPNPVWITSLDYGKLINVPTQFPPAPHTHDASAIVTGIIAPARLGTGTANNSVFLRGDSVWAVTTGQPQTPWAQTIVGAGFQLQNAGWIGVGTATIPIQSPIAGRAYITIRGTTDAGVIELATGSADADATLVGRVAYTDIANTQADKRSAFVDAYRSGAVAGNRGSALAFWTRPDGGSTPVQCMMLSNQGRLGVGTLNPAYAIDVVGDVNVTGCYRMGTSAFACPDSGGGGGIDLSNIVMINGAAPSSHWQAGSGGAIYYNGGNVGIGTATPLCELNVVSTNTVSSNRGILSAQYSNTVHGAVVQCQKYRGAPTAPAAIAVGDYLGVLDFEGNTSSGLADGASISAVAMVVASNTISADLTFQTVAAGSNSERMRITNAGNVGIGTTSPGAPLSIGTASANWGQVAFFGQSSDVINAIVLGRTGVANPAELWFGVNQASLYCSIQSARGGIGYTVPLVLNPSGANVGVIVSSPACALEVAAAATPTLGPTARFYHGPKSNRSIELGTGWGGGSPFAPYIQAYDAGTAPQVLCINPGGGYVGIALTNPTYQFHVYGSIYAQAGDLVVDTGHGVHVGAIDVGNYAGRGIDNNVGVYGGNLALQYGGPGFAGNVGIGTANPTGHLMIYTGVNSPQPMLYVYDGANSGGSNYTALITTDQPFSGAFTGEVLRVQAYPNGTNLLGGYIARFGTGAGDGSSFTSFLSVLGNGIVLLGPSSANQAGDLGVARNGSPATGVVYFGNTGTHYIYWDSANFNFTGAINISGAGLTCNGINCGGNVNITGQYQVNGVPINTSGGPTTWAGFTPQQRPLNTQFTNNTGKPLYVSVGVSGGTYSVNVVIAGQTPIVSGANGSLAMFFIVLPGQTYQVNTGGSFQTWYEWN